MSHLEDYPTLGFDPAPGKLTGVETLAHNFTRVSAMLAETHSALSQIGQAQGIWRGEAAEKFRGAVGELPGYLEKGKVSLGNAAGILRQWQHDLAAMQGRAKDYELQARTALDRVEQAKSHPDFALAGRHFPDEASLAEANTRLRAASERLGHAREELDAIRTQARRLLTQHEELADAVARALDRAKNEAPEEPGFFDRILDGIGKFIDKVGELAQKAWQWVKDHAEDIKLIGDVLSAVGKVLSIAAVCVGWIPVVGQVVTAAAVGVSAAGLAVHGLAKAAGADVSWKTLATDAIGVIPGGGIAKTMFGATKVISSANAAVGAARGAASVGQAVSRGAAAAKDVLATASRAQADKWLGTANRVAEALGKAPNTFAAGTQAGNIAAATVGAATTAAGTTGKILAEPYLDRAKEVGQQYYQQLTGGRPLTPANQAFNQVLHGRAA
ncbi:hypothetical protein M8C13_03750 [Crossiella sp. SN42]|uniref:putative T7SS-secreted protein n=1 Tax=Crossiella sp. SN42 TaxID=2944808 RepID=UPI00207D2CE8|nr:hypothetical protein [Crossiella sp. SN42]MCO1574873.1 hypothetical protein [Crossiella sp. SN42]